LRRWFGPRLSLLVDQRPSGSRGSRALHHKPGSGSQGNCFTSPQGLFLLRSLLSSLSSLLLPCRSSASTHALLSSGAPPPWPASLSGPTPLLGVRPLSLPIGRADTPSARQCDRSGIFYIRRKTQGDLVQAPQNRETLLLTIRRFGGKPRRSRTIALLWREFRAGTLAASPSIPWRLSCPHSARLMASAVCLMQWRCSELDGCCVEGAWQMM